MNNKDEYKLVILLAFLLGAGALWLAFWLGD
jgi:hypothetical protein